MKLIAGADGFLGNAVRENILARQENALFFTRKDYDFNSDKPIPAVGGIDSILYCADYYPGLEYTACHEQEIYETNVGMYSNLFALARANKIPKVITIGTTACYPIINEPLTEDLFMTRPISTLNQKMIGYSRSRFTLLAIAREAQARDGIIHRHFILPNLYGPRDKFEPEKSHLLSSWIRDFSAVKERKQPFITLWGSPLAQREYLYVHDAARYILALADAPVHEEILNVGTGLAPTYSTLACEILNAIDYYTHDRIRWDASRKNTRMKEVMNTNRLQTYSRCLPQSTALFSKGLKKTIDYYTSLRGLTL